VPDETDPIMDEEPPWLGYALYQESAQQYVDSLRTSPVGSYRHLSQKVPAQLAQLALLYQPRRGRLLCSAAVASCLRLILQTFGVFRTHLQFDQIGHTRERVHRTVSASQREAPEARLAMRVSCDAQT